jgi:hypothetical protein
MRHYLQLHVAAAEFYLIRRQERNKQGWSDPVIGFAYRCNADPTRFAVSAYNPANREEYSFSGQVVGERAAIRAAIKTRRTFATQPKGQFDHPAARCAPCVA